MHHKRRNYSDDETERSVFDKRESDINKVIVLPQTYDDVEHYVSLMRAAIFCDWNGQKELKESIIVKDLLLDFIESEEFIYKGEKCKAWIVVIPNPKKIEFDVESTSFGNIAVSDQIVLKWDRKANETELPYKFKKMIGEIQKIDGNELTASFILPIGLHPPDHVSKKASNVCRTFYTVTFLPSPIVTKRRLQAIDNIWECSPTIRNMILGTYKQIHPAKNVYINDDDPNINYSQRAAISKALTNEFTFIQGPPGCGKTHVIAAIVYQALIRNPNERILVCGPTNISIENLVFAINNRIRELGKCIVWSASRDMDFVSLDGLTEIQKSQSIYWMLQHKSENGALFQDKIKESRKNNKKNTKSFYESSEIRNKLEKEVLDEFPVVCCTLVSSGKNVIRNSHFSMVIIDEATQSIEAETLLPITKNTKRFIIVGDHNQLGPNVYNHTLKEIYYDVSLFHRLVHLYQGNNHFALLDCQYRMHPMICAFPNKEFYNGDIINGVSEKQRECGVYPMSFIDVKGNESIENSSFKNPEEANEVMSIIENLMLRKIKPEQIGVICPYGSQATFIRDKLSTLVDCNKLKIASIDGFQGNEKDYIIISMTRTNTESLSGFFHDPRRVSVALTRAKYGLIIIGNLNSFRGMGNAWGRLCDYCIEHNYVRKAFIKIDMPIKEKLRINKKSDEEDTKQEKQNGLDMTEVPITITNNNQKLRILWPDNPSEMDCLSCWICSMKGHLDENKQVTFVVNADSVCMQICSVFNRSFDLFDVKSTVPNIGTCNGVIIMFYNKDGTPHFDQNIQKMFNALLTHQNVTLITHDLTTILSIFQERNIQINPNRLIDVQESDISDNNTILLTPLSDMITDSYCSDSFLTKAREWVNSDGYKNFPFLYNDFLITYHKLPLISMVSGKFLRYKANDIPLIALACKNIFCSHNIEIFRSKTIMLYQEFYKEKAPKALRLAKIIRPVVTNMIVRTIEVFYSTDYLLKIWSCHKDLIEVYQTCQMHFEHVLRMNNIQYQDIVLRYHRLIEIIQKEKDHLPNIRIKSNMDYLKEKE